MTKALCRRYFQNFEMDPSLFADMSQFRTYQYQPEKCDELIDRYTEMGREYFAIMRDADPIGEVILKNIDQEKQCCTLGIHLQNDSVKNKGYGTLAEILVLEYAFNTLNMKVVYADAIHKNKRSQHVLEKVGFRKINSDKNFVYYQCDRADWQLNT